MILPIEFFTSINSLELVEKALEGKKLDGILSIETIDVMKDLPNSQLASRTKS